MSRISVNPNELEGLAADLQKLEDQCDDIKDSLKWNYNLLHATYWDVDSTSAGGLCHSLVQKLEHYQTLMNNAQAVVKRTEAQFREADQGWFNQAKEWGMELVGVNDVVRIFAEYDPVTGEKLDGWDRLQAAGWTALTIFPPAKLAGLGGKAIIKGAKVLKMGDKATEAFRGMMKVLHPDVMKNAFRNALKGVMNLPIFPKFSPQKAIAGIPGAGIGLHMGGSYKANDLVTFFAKSVTKAESSKLVNALNSFQGKNFIFENQNFLLDKRGMKHILSRHHPEFWDGSTKAKQSFLNKNMSIDEVADAIESVMNQNREILIKNGATSSYQIKGSYNGIQVCSWFQ
ncbi:pre-toxin TG domain-containing protein [Fictibacillus fluitans]|uniref:Pre-toxin TG domain-containing protein n=1 Tax=Fictibacillus fluitans TaxID=3058422 RepID=A0ABT8I071_9BACL|nr:pre-toxin TG domain-containing protein [Fictibacillus sp. NE201]MDN4526130.1 pre-toxin TG domain-containing protein [Fictibacillus sp. NE201]